MNLTSARGTGLLRLAMSSLLLIFAASCSLEKEGADSSIGKPVAEDPIEEGIKDETTVTNAHEVLIEEEAAGEPLARQAEETPPADNSFCYVCHINYDGEKLARNHERAGIGCAECHGRSYAHSGDENNITPPEIMYPKAKINPSCLHCHPRDKIGEVETHEHVFSGDPGQEKHCTDCHGKGHRLNIRTVRWDKASGALLKE
jgi:hypothetical protein